MTNAATNMAWMTRRTTVVIFAILFLVVLQTTLFGFMRSKLGRWRRQNGGKNVLLIIADDLRPELGSYSGEASSPTGVHPAMHTPNLDRLASRSLVLKRAYVQQALCGPSRTSFLTGRRPDTTRVYDVTTYWRESGGDFTTIPQHFKANGYNAVGMGKIFHKTAAGGYDEPSWSTPFRREYGYPDIRYEHSWRAVPPGEIDTDPTLQDASIVRKAVKNLQQLAPKALDGEQPFFLAVGFHKPHLPFIFPEEFLDYYPKANIAEPSNPYAPVNLPQEAWSSFAELQDYEDIEELDIDSEEMNATLPSRVVLELRRAYYASVSYMDHNVGVVLNELDRLGLQDTTIVAFLGDHGYQLGEHAQWCKHTNFELATRTPLMVRLPGLTDRGASSDELVELVDLFPTLVEAAGLAPLPVCPRDSSSTKLCREGSSLLPLLNGARKRNGKWKGSVFSQYPWPHASTGKYIQKMGYSVRNVRFVYGEWVAFQVDDGPDWDAVHAIELYDLKKDPDQNVNRANDSTLAAVRDSLHRLLRDGWRSVLVI